MHIYIYLCRVTRENARLMSHIPGNRKRNIYIYIYIYVYVYIYTYVYIYIYAHICIFVQSYT